MTTYLLDTNICIECLRDRHQKVTARFRACSKRDLRTCSIVIAELIYGALRSDKPSQNLHLIKTFATPIVSLAFDNQAALEYGRIRCELEKLGTPIGPNDMLIAAIALANDVTLVTHNTREFARISGLKIEDWHS